MIFVFIILVFFLIFSPRSPFSYLLRSKIGMVGSSGKMNVKKLGFVSPRNFQIVNDLLHSKFDFYRQMNEVERHNFIYRTIFIYDSKSIIGMEGLELSLNHKLLISSTIARLTFGIKSDFDLPTFEVIQVFPQQFYSRLYEQDVKGLTVGVGNILISWKDFYEGISDDDDRINLGLHEFAHAMMIEFDHFENHWIWQEWKREAQIIRRRMMDGETFFFRAYGSTNLHEFWAVAVECFFEQPHQFREYYPRLYRCMTGIIHQDLAHRFGPTK